MIYYFIFFQLRVETNFVNDCNLVESQRRTESIYFCWKCASSDNTRQNKMYTRSWSTTDQKKSTKRKTEKRGLEILRVKIFGSRSLDFSLSFSHSIFHTKFNDEIHRHLFDFERTFELPDENFLYWTNLRAEFFVKYYFKLLTSELDAYRNIFFKLLHIFIKFGCKKKNWKRRKENINFYFPKSRADASDEFTCATHDIQFVWKREKINERSHIASRLMWLLLVMWCEFSARRRFTSFLPVAIVRKYSTRCCNILIIFFGDATRD